jgi:ArsR family transcriptional regulator
VTDSRFPLNIDVKCAGCGSYFSLDQVTKYKNGYYCRYCYPDREHLHKSRYREVTCAVCGKVLTDYDTKVRDGGKCYCPVCYHKDLAGSGDPGEDAAGKAVTEARCTVCGKKLAPEETRALYVNNCYCIACYDKSTPYPDPKLPSKQSGDAVASMRSDRKVNCVTCKRDLGPFDVKIMDGRTIYCEGCYRSAREAPGNRRFFLAEQAGINTRPGVTSLKDAADIVECTNCGWVITRDRLETFPKDAKGRLRCPRCDKKFVPPGIRAPDNAKQEKPKREKKGTEDFALTAQLFKCLGDPCRVKIIESLSEKELCVFEFVDLTGSQYSAISYHLKMLKELDIVRSYERGNFMVYSLTDKGQIVHEFIEKSKSLK